MSQIAFQLRQLAFRMWFMPAAFSFAAVLTIGLAYLLARFAPEELPFILPENSVGAILTILASSLLTVAVFALSTMVGALSGASASTTPRAVPLIIGDRSAQMSISIFIGAFLFSIVGIIGLNAGFYSEAGRLFLFGVTLAVLVLVVAALIRWIGQISSIGRVSETIDRVERATSQAFQAMHEHPCLDAQRLIGEPKGNALMAPTIGYVQHVDAAKLQKLAEEHDLTIAITALPGAYAAPDRPILHVEGELGEDVIEALGRAFTIGDTRSFDNDPRFGLIVLSEIAGTALTPSRADSGTAIDVIGTLVRVLHGRSAVGAMDEPRHNRVFVPELDPRDMVEDAFRPIARDGAGLIEVVQRLLAGLETLAVTCPDLRQPVLDMARDAAERARGKLSAPCDLRALEAAVAFAGK